MDGLSSSPARGEQNGPEPTDDDVDGIVDDVLQGRRFPYSRAFTRAGFSREDAERWRRAGWLDPDEAAPWHAIPTDAPPTALRELFLARVDHDDVANVARFAPHLTLAWLHAWSRTDVVDLRDGARAELSIIGNVTG